MIYFTWDEVEILFNILNRQETFSRAELFSITYYSQKSSAASLTLSICRSTLALAVVEEII